MFGASLDSMVGQLTTVAAPNAGGVMNVDTSDPWVMFVGGLLLLLVCAGGASAAKKSSDKKFKKDEVERKQVDETTVQYIEKSSGKVLFEGTRMEAMRWKREHVESDKYAERR